MDKDIPLCTMRQKSILNFTPFPFLYSYFEMRHFIIPLLLIFIHSCNTTENKEWHCDFTTDDFERIEMTVNDDGNVLDFTEELLGKPSMLTILDNNCIAVKDRGNDKMVWLINLDNEEAKSFVPRGVGPEELLDLTTMSYHDGILSLAGLNDSKVLDFEIDYDSLKFNLVNHTVLPYIHPMRSIHLNDSTILSLANAFSGDRYYIYNMLDSTYESSGDFPVDSALVKMKPDNAFFQTDIAVNREKNIMVVANRWWGIIEICNLKSREWNRYFGPVPTEAIGIKDQRGDSYSFRQEPRWSIWDEVYAGQDKIYIGYNGSCRRSKEDSLGEVKEIYVIDYEGKPDRIYSFDEEIVGFTIDEKNGSIYIIHELPEPVLVRYPLKSK